MSALEDPIVLALILGVMTGVAVVIGMMLRLRGTKSPHTQVVQAHPDRRAQRLDDAVASSPVLRRAVQVVTNLASRRGFLGSVERSLRAADVPVRPGELMLAQVCAIAFVPSVTFLVTRSVVFVAVAFLLVGVAPMYALRFIAKRRSKRFALQLPDALTALAGSLRAGRSVGQAMDALSKELEDPIGRELRKVVAETRLGRSLQDALADEADRIGSDDFRWAVLAMQIQAEVGGNLAELLDHVAGTIRGRAQMKGEVKALTAEGRASAIMLVVLVPGLGLVMTAMNSKYMSPLFSTTPGRIMVGVSFVMISAGYMWMKSMVKIDA